MSKKIIDSKNFDNTDWSDDGDDDETEDSENENESENESEQSKEKEESESEDDIDKNLFFCPCNSVILKKRHLLIKHYYTSKHQKYMRDFPEEN